MGIDAGTRLYCVMGEPVRHSQSPVMHNAAFACKGLNSVYTAFRVRDIAAAVTGLRALNIGGASVTLPHKVAVMEYLDEVDTIAATIGAVNTIANREGFLFGCNSDWIGAVRALSEKTGIAGKKAAVIGAGGAARAIAYGISAEGGLLTVINRSADKGEQLAGEFGGDFLPLSAADNHDCEILINTTSVGMNPESDVSPVPAACLRPGMVVMDIVYNPLETFLLQEARRRGCTTVDGLSMFVYQGAFQFSLWTGQTAPVQVMREAVLQKLRITS